RGDITVSQASWLFQSWLPYADACSPKNVTLLPLDWRVVEDQSEFDSPEEIQWMRQLTDSGRRVVPIIWSHHDDGHYIGRTYTPYNNFASHLAKAGCDSYGIIHWSLRPHGLFFKSHSVQVWQTTKDQPLQETCRIMARNIFGTEGEQTGGEYLYDWIHSTPMYGRDTSDFMIDRPFSNDKLNTVQKESQRRQELLAKIQISHDNPSAQRHLAYWKGLEEFNVRFWVDENSLQQSIEALKTGDVLTAQKWLDKAEPISTLKKYAAYASQLGIIPGDRGLLVLMNLKWYPAFVGLNQTLGRDNYRINFAPTFSEPLAQGEGHRSFHIDTEKNLWLVQGDREVHGKQWTWSEKEEQKTDPFSESEKEIVKTGIHWSESVQIPIVPAMISRFGSAKLNVPSDSPRTMKVYVADPNVKKQGDTEFDLILCGNRSDTDSFTFEPVRAKYLRLVCHGNNLNTWNSIYELETPSRLKNGEVKASNSVQDYPAIFSCDGKKETRWAVDGNNEWIQIELDPNIPFEKLQIRWYASEREYRYEIGISSDGQSWKAVTPENGGQKSLQPITVSPIPGTAQVFNFTVPKEFQHGLSLRIQPKKGNASLCGIILEQ
ncbi:MAG: discoidin domain-containing protein, partial [Planctomycetaceae bacterium]|nr:discoidin domain-containing protein [Planctomycetaceae bacterium]